MGDIHHPTCVPLRARISYLVIERGTLHAAAHSLVLSRESGDVEIPCAQASVLLLEPGVSVTHAAVKMCADHGTFYRREMRKLVNLDGVILVESRLDSKG